MRLKTDCSGLISVIQNDFAEMLVNRTFPKPSNKSNNIKINQIIIQFI